LFANILMFFCPDFITVAFPSWRLLSLHDGCFPFMTVAFPSWRLLCLHDGCFPFMTVAFPATFSYELLNYKSHGTPTWTRILWRLNENLRCCLLINKGTTVPSLLQSFLLWCKTIKIESNSRDTLITVLRTAEKMHIFRYTKMDGLPQAAFSRGLHHDACANQHDQH